MDLKGKHSARPTLRETTMKLQKIIGLTLLTVLGVTWNPTRVSPVTILNERN